VAEKRRRGSTGNEKKEKEGNKWVHILSKRGKVYEVKTKERVRGYWV